MPNFAKMTGSGAMASVRPLLLLNFAKLTGSMPNSMTQVSGIAPQQRRRRDTSGGDDERDDKTKNRRRRDNRDISRDQHGAWSLGPDASNASTAVPAAQSNRKSNRGASNQRQRRREATRPKIVAAEKIVRYFTIRTALSIGTCNSGTMVPVVPPDQTFKRGALLGPKRHPKCQDRTSNASLFF